MSNEIAIIISAQDKATDSIKKVQKEVGNLNTSVMSLVPSWKTIATASAVAFGAVTY